MKTTSFSKNSIIFCQFLAILLIANTLTPAKSKYSKKKTVKVPEFQEDQCFCGVRFDKTKKLNLDFFGPGIAGKILNYVDQSISKFNGLNLTSELALTSLKNKKSKKDNYYISSERFMKQKTIQKEIVDRNGTIKNNLRITYMKSVLFTTDNLNNNLIVLDYMMGHKVSFRINIKFLDIHKKQFDISFIQKPYVPGNPAKTTELLRKKSYSGYTTSRSLSHFDKNQLQVDVCRMMYTALSQISMREFNTSISAHIGKFGKTRNTYTKTIGCSRDVVFRERFTNDYLTWITQVYYGKLQKTKNPRGIRAKLEIGDTNNYKVVVQEFNEELDEVTREASQDKIDLFNDESHDSSEKSEMESETSEHTDIIEKRTADKVDIDQDSQTSSQDSSVKSSQKIEEKNQSNYQDEIEDVYNLRNRDVPKTLPQRSPESKSSKSSESQKDIIENTTSDEDVYHLRNRDVSKIIVQNPTPKSRRSESQDIQDLLEKDDHSSQESLESFETGNNKSFNSESFKTPDTIQKNLEEVSETSQKSEIKITEVEVSDKKKKRKRVIVLIESIECSKCKNDIKTEVFLRLLNNKSFMI